MRVALVAYTPDPLMVVGRAAHTCYSPSGPDGGELSRERAARIVEKCIQSGHMSVLEHASFTFEVEGISRACSHQLVRHRIASYSQQSQRYVRMDGFEYVVPESIRRADDGHALEAYEAFMDQVREAYHYLRDSCGVPLEDARMVLPNACATRITITMNARALFNFFATRLCNKAQWEIREMAERMYREAVKVFPEAFQLAGPPCITDRCHEADPCEDEVLFGAKTMRRDAR